MKRLLPVLMVAVLVGGCQQQMADQPRADPLDASPLFPDGSSARRPVPGTVALDEVPVTPPAVIDLALLERGQERYNVFCSPCHDYTGHGRGMVVQSGFPAPPDFHSPVLLGVSDQHIFDVITHGYGVMYSYASRVPAADRWAIVAYVRALQYAERVPASDVPEAMRAKLDEAQP